MPDPSLVDPPKVPPPGFREIAQSLTSGQPPQVTSKSPLELMPPDLLVGPTMATLMVTRISQDKVIGITYMDTVTASMGLVALETSHVATDHRPTMLEDVTDVTNL